jgi:hypothetical protein
MKDFESFFSRKEYAKNVTGAYYANRLSACEYLEKIKKQAQIIFLREISEEYYAPLGVGILRELARKAFLKEPEKPKDLSSAFDLIQSRLKIPMDKFKEVSILLKEYGKQKKLNRWLI